MFKSKENCCCIDGHKGYLSITNIKDFTDLPAASSVYDPLYIPKVQKEGVCYKCKAVIRIENALEEDASRLARLLMNKISELNSDLSAIKKVKK